MLFVVAIAGGVGARKQRLAKQLSELVTSRYQGVETTTLSLASFKIDDAEAPEEPSGLDLSAVLSKLDEVGQNSASDDDHLLVVFVEGVYAMLPNLRAKSDLRIFIDTDADTRLSNQVVDANAAGMPLDQILTAWINQVKPSHDKYVNELKNHADVILPRGISNEGGVATIGTYLLDAVARRLKNKGDLVASQTLITGASIRSLRESDKIFYDSS